MKKEETNKFINDENSVDYINLSVDPDYTIKPLKVLIAEDHEIWASYIKLVLRKISSEILYAKNGNEAVEICLNNPDIDLILMDINMPMINGYEAAKQIRKFNKDIIIVEQSSEPNRTKAIENGFNDSISKPFFKVELQMILDKYFNN